jgi:hypothetical protein
VTGFQPDCNTNQARAESVVLTLSPGMPSLWGRSDHSLPTAQELAEKHGAEMRINYELTWQVD